MHSAEDLVMCLDDINGHVGRHFDGVNGGHGVGQANLQGRMLLVLPGEGIMCEMHGYQRGKE